MTPAEYQRVGELFLAARRLSPRDRAVYIENNAASPWIRAELLSMLAADSDDADVLATPPIDSRTASAAPPAPPQIAGFELIELIGEGGMGLVYRARQARPAREVALKVLRVAFADEHLLRRFELEAQTIGRLAHPGIAHLYESGAAQTALGPLPYFAMELVSGRPLTEFARLERLDVRAQLALLIAVCDAVQHAHQRGVLHRDLKPANILVSPPPQAGGAPQPKVLDFGVARLLERGDADRAGATRAGELVGTPAYMSPEQAGGAPDELDTRSDVYALGVIGFELLAGRRPRELPDGPLSAVLRALDEPDPLPLAEVKPEFAGDLDAIFRKALQRDKELRYSSAAELATDLRRYLADEPVHARQPTLRAQLRRFARRHRTFVAASVTAAVTLLLGAVGTTWFALDALQQRNIARDHLERERAANRIADGENVRLQAMFNFLSEALLRVASDGRRDAPFEELLDRAAADTAVAFADQELLEAPIRSVLGLAYQAIGRRTDAEQQLRIAVRLHEQHPEHPLHRDVALANLTQLELASGRAGEARRVAQRRSDALLAAFPTRAEQLAPDVRDALLDALTSAGRFGELVALLEAALHDSELAADARNSLRIRLIEALESAGRLDQADEAARAALGDRTPDGGRARLVLSRVELKRGRLAEAVAQLRVLLSETDVSDADRPLNAAMLAQCLARAGDAAEALNLAREALASLAEQALARPADAGRARLALGTTLYILNQPREAESELRAALDALLPLIGEEADDFLCGRAQLAELLDSTGRHAEAGALFARVLGAAQDAPASPLWRIGEQFSAYALRLRERGQAQDAARFSAAGAEILARALGHGGRASE